jgi:RNA polymerase sigma-70 factor (ECF subfamily)
VDKFEAWMKVIVIRLAWKARAEQKRVESLSDFENKLSYDIESKLFDRMTCMEVLKTLEVVPFGSREVFKMYVLEGYRHAEIAKILEISESTSRVHLSKARKLLKNIFVNVNYQKDEQKAI